jgi:HPt (histidine-containing phosphotransfer) domain-containing protein
MPIIMTPDMERMKWMPSPPLVPCVAVIDIDHLQRMTLGDKDLEREVLALFEKQAVSLLMRLEALPADAGALAHTLKGSAQGIGAFAIADAAEALEDALRCRKSERAALAAVKDCVTEALDAIEDIFRTS